MAISVGDTVPDVEAQILGPDDMPKNVRTGDLLGKGKIVLFAVPGAFTPGCSRIHLPGFVEGHHHLAAKGVEKVVCTSVNDPWVMDAWSDSVGAEEIIMLADGNGAFAAAMGLTVDAAVFGLGERSQRYAAVIQDGVVEALRIDDGGEIRLSSCVSVLEIL